MKACRRDLAEVPFVGGVSSERRRGEEGRTGERVGFDSVEEETQVDWIDSRRSEGQLRFGELT